MKNNNENWQDHKDSLGSAISAVAYPFNSVKEKLDEVKQAYFNSEESKEKKDKIYKEILFKKYFDSPEIFNFYGLFVPEPECL